MKDHYYKYAFFSLSGAVFFYMLYRAYSAIMSAFRKPIAQVSGDSFTPSVSFGVRG